MQLPQHIEIIYKLDGLRTAINGTVDKNLMISIAQSAFDIVAFVETKKEGKDKIIQLLENEIRTYSKSNTEIEVVQFQLASTLLMLSLQFIEGSLNDMQAVIIEYKKRAA